MAAKQSAEMRKALQLIESKGLTVYEAAERAGIGASAIYRHLRKHKMPTPTEKPAKGR